MPACYPYAMPVIFSGDKKNNRYPADGYAGHYIVIIVLYDFKASGTGIKFRKHLDKSA